MSGNASYSSHYHSQVDGTGRAVGQAAGDRGIEVGGGIAVSQLPQTAAARSERMTSSDRGSSTTLAASASMCSLRQLRQLRRYRVLLHRPHMWHKHPHAGQGRSDMQQRRREDECDEP